MRPPPTFLPDPYRLSMANRPSHPEAYPSFSVGEAYREGRLGRDHLLWRDRSRIIAGAATVWWLDPTSLVVRYAVEERDWFEQAHDEITLQISWKGSQEDNRRPFAACPACRRDVDVLVFVDSWCCTSKRHGLRHRSAQLSREARWSEDLADVDGALALAGAVGAAGKRSQVLVARRDALLARLGGRAATANVLQLARVTREWVRPLAVQEQS